MDDAIVYVVIVGGFILTWLTFNWSSPRRSYKSCIRSSDIAAVIRKKR